jgi:hypothetical protein
MEKLNFTNAADELQLVAGVNATAEVFQVSGPWPVSPPFTVIVNPDTSVEEIVKVTEVTGTATQPTWTVERGVGDNPNTDGLSFDHTVGAVIRHAATAQDFNLIYDMASGEGNVVTKNDPTWGDLAPISAENPAPTP